MSDDRDRAREAEIVDLPLGAPPHTAGSRGGIAVAEPADASGLDLPSSRRRAVAHVGDGRQIVCEGLVRIYKVADLEVVALQGLDLVVGVGEMIAIVGASGSGKSTLLNIL